jgi:hypothetical protein
MAQKTALEGKATEMDAFEKLKRMNNDLKIDILELEGARDQLNKKIKAMKFRYMANLKEMLFG